MRVVHYQKVVGRHADEAYDKAFTRKVSSSKMAEIIEQRVGIDRCEGTLQTFFALTLMEQGKFEWRSRDGHEWEVGRWPGLRLTLLAQPEWGPHRPALAICPLPGNGNEVPFILLITLQERIHTSYQETEGTAVTLFNITAVEVKRDVASCAYRAFDLAVRLQQPHLQARYTRLGRRTVPILPCMKSLMEIQYRFTAPMAGIYRVQQHNASMTSNQI
jgi:hypothetical protein